MLDSLIYIVYPNRVFCYSYFFVLGDLTQDIQSTRDESIESMRLVFEIKKKIAFCNQSSSRITNRHRSFIFAGIFFSEICSSSWYRSSCFQPND